MVGGQKTEGSLEAWTDKGQFSLRLLGEFGPTGGLSECEPLSNKVEMAYTLFIQTWR